MKESQLNTIITKSFRIKGFAHKIADPMGGTGIQNPFDGFAVLLGLNIFFESKLLKPLKAFNFNAIEEHQYANLELIKLLNESNICIYTIGVFEPYKYFYLFIFDHNLIKYLKSMDKKSILKKELLIFIDRGLFLNIVKNKEDKKYIVDLENLKEKMITIDTWEETFNENTRKI